MAKAKFLPLLTCGGSGLKSSRSKKDVVTATAASNETSDTVKSQEELLMLLNNFPESESESDRELSFSFLLSNSSPEKEKYNVIEEGGKIEDQCKEVAAAKVKKQRKISSSRCSSGRIGVLLNLHVPVSFTDNSRSLSGHESSCITLEELEKREMGFNRVGCWPTLHRRKQDQSKVQLEVVQQLTC